MVIITAIAAAGVAVASAFGVTLVAGSMTAFAIGLGANIVLGMALNALTPKSSAGGGGGGSRGYQVNSRGSALDHQVIYGKVRVGGAILYDEATGNTNKYFHRIVGVAGHEVTSFEEIYLNDEIVTLDGSGNVTSPSRYNNKVRIKTHLGSSTQAADVDLVNESTHWTGDHRLRGIAYIYARFSFDADVFPNGIPVITATVKGKKVYSPLTSLTEWSDNPALCIRDYLTNQTYGLGETSENIDETLVISSATLCNQTNTEAGTTRYTCNGAFTTAVTPYDMLNSLLTSMGGSLWYSQGKWRMKPSHWTSPVLSLNEDDLRSSVSVSTRHSRRDGFNTVRGTFRGEESNWQVTDYPQVTNPFFVTTDNGQVSTADIDLPFTDNSIEARRIARIALEGNREQLTVSASFGLRALKVQVGDNINLTNSRFGWDNKSFQVISWTFGLTDGLDLQVDMLLKETSPQVFDEVNDGLIYERNNTTLESPYAVTTVGLSSATRTQIIREKLTNVITLTVTSGASERIDYVEAEFKLSSSPNWITLGTGQLGDFEAVDLEDGNYDFRARAINTFGVKGDWSFLSDVNASGLLTPPSDVENFVAVVNGAVITLDWDPVPDLDLSYYRIRYSPETSGATWANSVTYVDKVPRPATSTSVPARSGTFLVKAFDKSGIGSTGSSFVSVPIVNIEPLANTFTQTESPAFTGTKTNTEVVGTSMRILSYPVAPSTGEYFFSNYIETGDNTARRCRVYVSTVTSRHDNTAGLFDDQGGFFDDGVGLFDDLGGNGQFADTNITTLVSTTPDDPAGSPTWSDYTPIKVADIFARAFRFKVILASSADNITPSISALTAYVEYN